MNAPTASGLSAPVTSLRSVGLRAATKLSRLGIRTVRHLLWHLPSRYEDYRQTLPIAQVVPGEKQNVRGEIVTISTRNIWPRRMTITTAVIRDDSGGIRAVWFNQPYLEEALPEGTTVSLAGKVVLDKRGLYLSGPVYEKITPESSSDDTVLRHTGRLVPVYPETEGVTSKFLRFLIKPVLEQLELDDPLPASIRRRFGLVDLGAAVRTVHYPDTVDAVTPARARLAFDDLLILQLKALTERRLLNLQRSPAVPMDAAFMRSMVATLPFKLTRDQRVAALEILRDMERPFPMNRLMEGDVGSGKTVVAFLAAMHAARSGWQTAVLAPTEVLARQHMAVALGMLRGIRGVQVALLTGTDAFVNGTVCSKAYAKRMIRSGAVTLVIGTHALLQKDVIFPRLALVVIDEQHRFGIQQRAALTAPKTNTKGMVPHLLSMTATPIPRTLALTVFGDLDISIIKEKPAGRRPIETHVVSGMKRRDVYETIRSEAKLGHQTFVICPAIETAAEDTGTGRQRRLNPLWADVKAVRDEHARLARDVFPDLKVAMLHGKMKSAEKERVMREFRAGRADVLVTTSVIEVGVDVPNASVMLIEGADRFGLAQLHQFRGRVGRSEYPSRCYLIATDEGAGRERLAALERSDDGFALAETDLRLRGPGEFFGIKQSGVPDLTMAALTDVELIKKARLAARLIMRVDPTLARAPILREQLANARTLVHAE
ncbi:MAG TPA: ATP-dependent DNA helicase RecG [Candidatus Paceibacterota bacterium]|nr:ATP-dependent DNA helicase RecG [Candidatus Paceibacterota bacterium]